MVTNPRERMGMQVGDLVCVKRAESYIVWELIEVYPERGTALAALPTGQQVEVGPDDVWDVRDLAMDHIEQLNSEGRLIKVI